MKITDIRATTVTVPLEAPLRHANGCHWGRFVRTIVEVETDEGIVGLGEMGGGGESAEATFRAMKTYLVGHDPARIEEMRFLHRQPHRVALQQPHAGARRPRVRLPRHLRARSGTCPSTTSSAASSRTACRSRRTCSSAIPGADGKGEVRTVDQLVAHAKRAEAEARLHHPQAQGRRLPPGLRAGVLQGASPPRSRATRSAFDPNGVWSTEQAIRFGQAIEDLNNDYFEDPVFGMQRHAPRARDGPHPAGDEHRRRQLRAARRQRPRHRRRRHPARHDLLGRHPPVRQGGGRVRDVPARRRRALVGRAGHPARDDAAPGRRHPEPLVRRRRALPPPRRRRDRGREDAST